jgi:aerobic-type carbon monoxide dehydrogenase small subunit (CoxS/CutS family)
MIALNVNGKRVEVDAENDTPLLWVLRDYLDVTGWAGKAVQDAWVAENVPQCGYCQSGQVMAATALLASNNNPSDAAIDAAMTGNICRCATYPRIRAAIKRAAKSA